MVGLVHLFHYVQSVLCEYYRTYIMCVGSFSFIMTDRTRRHRLSGVCPRDGWGFVPPSGISFARVVCVRRGKDSLLLPVSWKTSGLFRLRLHVTPSR